MRRAIFSLFISPRFKLWVPFAYPPRSMPEAPLSYTFTLSFPRWWTRVWQSSHRQWHQMNLKRLDDRPVTLFVVRLTLCRKYALLNLSLFHPERLSIVLLVGGFGLIGQVRHSV